MVQLHDKIVHVVHNLRVKYDAMNLQFTYLETSDVSYHVCKERITSYVEWDTKTLKSKLNIYLSLIIIIYFPILPHPLKMTFVFKYSNRVSINKTKHYKVIQLRIKTDINKSYYEVQINLVMVFKKYMHHINMQTKK